MLHHTTTSELFPDLIHLLKVSAFVYLSCHRRMTTISSPEHGANILILCVISLCHSGLHSSRAPCCRWNCPCCWSKGQVSKSKALLSNVCLVFYQHVNGLWSRCSLKYALKGTIVFAFSCREPQRILEGEETQLFWHAIGGRAAYSTAVQLEVILQTIQCFPHAI